MAVYHDITDAVPPTGGGPVKKTELRNTITARLPYILFDTDNPEDLICVDPDTGSAIIDIIYLGRLFHYDPTDTETEGDGVTCIVSNDGRRYKLTDGADVFAYSVLDNNLSAPPDDPSLGDAHLVAAAATGDWAGHEDEVAVFTTREWEFINFGVGRLLYIEGSDVYVHRKTDGSWVTGFGNLTIGPSSVPPSAAINFGNRFIVENQTTSTLPGTATVGTAYVRTSDLKLAVCEVADNFTIYTPKAGWSIYDKALKSAFTWDGTSWLSTAGTWIDRKAISTVSGSTTAPLGTTNYAYSTGTAPTTSVRRLIDTATISFSAKKANAVLRLHYSADVTFSTGSADIGTGDLVIAVFRDSGTGAVAWQRIPLVDSLLTAINKSLVTHLDHWFKLTAPDTSSHTYTVAILSKTGFTNQQTDASAPTLRDLEIEEAA
jgi:hypothetical protein